MLAGSHLLAIRCKEHAAREGRVLSASCCLATRAIEKANTVIAKYCRANLERLFYDALLVRFHCPNAARVET